MYRRCTHCCLECSPDETVELTEEKINSLVDYAINTNKIKQVSITGGEPFLRENLVFEIIKKVSSANKNITCITNGFWATSYDVAYSKLMDLYTAGLNTLSISIDEFHQKYIPIENIKNILDARIQIPIKLSLYMTITHKVNGYKILEALDESLIDVPVYRHPAIQVGRAHEISKSDLIEKYDITKPMHCGDRALLINNDGKCYPCCSPVVFETNLGVGNIYESDIESIWNNTENNLLLYVLRKEGLNWFVNTLRNNHILNLKSKYGSPCDLCKKIFSCNGIIDILKPYLFEYYEKNKISIV